LSLSTRPSSDTRRLVLIVATIAAVVAVPSAIVGGIDWLDLSGSWFGTSRPQPKWLTSGDVKATTSDGTLVKLRVAFDVPDGATRSVLQRQLREVTLVLELSIGALTTAELAGASGIERLSREMLRRVNDYLRAQGVSPLRSVAIQDLWYTRP
jgi:hypothetical protein